MSLIVREASAADILRLEELEQLCFSVPWTAETLLRELGGEGRIFLAAECEGVLAGYMGLQYVLDEGYITNVAAAPEFRQRGIASALIAEMVSRAWALGLSFLTLEVRESNSPARALYMKHGFKEEGRRRAYYENPVEDAILMTKFLK
jgi:ribosomal-protein-alanine N-acetyltransferase